MELFHGWKVLDYLKFAKHRFSHRQVRWRSNEAAEDESLSEEIRGIDLLCFSTQYYFILCLSTTGILFNVFAIQVFLKKNYNPFSDKMGPFLAVLIYIICFCIHRLCFFVGKKFLWHVDAQSHDGDDGMFGADILKKDWENEGMYMGSGRKNGDFDVTSDTFRHRFLENNREWILRQLGVASPRSKLAMMLAGGSDDEDSDGRKDVDISDDEGSDSDWRRGSGGPVNLDDTSRDIARKWLSRTRNRLGMPAPQNATFDISSDDETADSDEKPVNKVFGWTVQTPFWVFT